MRSRIWLRILALCLLFTTWAFLLAGCGGGSSSPQSAGSTEASAGASPGSTTTGSGATAGSANAGDAPSRKPSGSGAGGGGEAPEGGDGGTAGKHGPRIRQPKGEPEPTITPKETREATVADMTLQSPAIQPNANGVSELPARYTCDGEDSWPQLHWGGIPAGTAEVAVYAMSVAPIEGQLFVDWAVAGIDPAAEGIEAGRLPKGAIVGTNGFGKRGYSICPPGKEELYMFAAYALPRSLPLSPGFDARETREQILDVSGNVGLLPVSYGRP